MQLWPLLACLRSSCVILQSVGFLLGSIGVRQLILPLFLICRFFTIMDALAADVELVVSFLDIVALGVDVATTAQFASVNGVPRLLQPLARVHHLAAIKTDYTFFVGDQLSIEHQDLPRAQC